MKNCPYCGVSENFHFNISSKIYSWCSECNLIYKESHDSYDKVVAYYRTDYYRMHSVDQMNRKRGSLFDRILDLIEKKGEMARY